MPRGHPVLGRTSQPCSTADDCAQTHAEHATEDPELRKAARPSQSFRGKSPNTTTVPDDSASQAHPDDIDDFEQKGGFRCLTSAGKLQVLKSKLPLETLMSGIRLGRSERAVRAYLTNGILNKADVKLQRNYLEQVGVEDHFHAFIILVVFGIKFLSCCN